MLAFHHNENVEKIYGRKEIMEIYVAHLRKSIPVPQCKRCRAYGHTHRCCTKQLRCVRCTITVEAKKFKDA